MSLLKSRTNLDECPVPDSYFALSSADRRDALGVAAAQSGRPADLLEKDIWVVWALGGLFAGHFAGDLTFKGGTSLSKGFGVIRRFSEDVDITYDIRALLPDETRDEPEALPHSRSQMERWTKAVKEQLPIWVEEAALPVLRNHLAATGADAIVEPKGSLIQIQYGRVTAISSKYVRPVVQVEFGARSTGEPSQIRNIICDAAVYLPSVIFPTAAPAAMTPERTFWEKATSAHVYCLSNKLPAERYARHWYDLVRLEQTGFARSALQDRALAESVARHKSCFFRAKNADGQPISYEEAVTGHLQLEPKGEARERLAEDYARMTESGLLEEDSLTFPSLMDACRALQDDANKRG